MSATISTSVSPGQSGTVMGTLQRRSQLTMMGVFSSTTRKLTRYNTSVTSVSCAYRGGGGGGDESRAEGERGGGGGEREAKRGQRQRHGMLKLK